MLLSGIDLPAQIFGPAGNVKAWEGTIRVRGNTSGSHSHPVMGQDDWNVSYSGDLKVRLDTKSPYGPIWTGTVTGTAAIDATQSHTLVGCTTTNTLKGSGPPTVPYKKEQVVLQLTSTGEYHLILGADVIQAHWSERTQCAILPKPPQDGDDLYTYFSDETQMVGPLPVSDAILRGSADFTRNTPFERPTFMDGEPPVSMQVEWELHPAGAAEEDEVIILLTDEYRQFRPEAAAGGGAGSGLRLTARLQKKGGGAPSARAALFEWKFVQCSREPGFALNAPFKDASVDPDLRFEAASNFIVTDQEGQQGSTPPGQWETSTAAISAHDWGAWGSIQVSAILLDGRRILGHLEGDTAQTDVRLPKRADGDLIAEIWRAQKGVGGRSDTSDDEADPVGDGTAGDGLTLYEEYRGFIENGQHIEGNPFKKDYFIHNRAGGVYLSGIRLFRRLSGLDVHYEMTADELSMDRVVNFNRAMGPHRVDQHGVEIFLFANNPGYAIASGGPGNPVKITGVFVPALTPPVQPGTARYFNSTLAHELFHACNVYHHGDGGDRDVTWRRVPGTDTVLEKAGGNEQQVSILREDGTLINSLMPEAPLAVTLGMKDGPHCGEDDCVMRYDVSGGYIADTDPTLRYRVQEATGMKLCSSGAGTGVNDANRTPQSRYGPAAAGRGTCSSQILVNDAVKAPER
ncbi:zinc metalloprotease [Paludibaculum fermentans]|uniref:Uncharacterized protein n=1 Tax=Paludibaculum fermentans TaxID=1473598 RepID=A0A7S7SNY4_PALFE|nr:hypothetical protein [Paludibaculum fermentans]QOY90610.1 hypothetical protein IRI77_11875 [Paludibaculum fermentans]